MKRATGKSNLSIVQDYVNGNRPFIQVGYTAESAISERKDGEIWTDAKGKKWIKKNGYKKSINNVNSSVIDATRQVCKDCGMDIKWGNRLDQKFFNKTGKCYDCLIKYETDLRLKGLFKDYEKKKILNNQYGFAKDFRAKMEESLKFLESHDTISFPNSDGTQDIWSIEQKDEMIKGIKKDLKKTNKAIIKIENELRSLPDFEKSN